MTVQLLGAKRAYTALSGDTKPVTVSGNTVPPGSTLFETDTGREYEWDGYRWSLVTEDAKLGDLLRDVIAELQEVKAVLQDTKALHENVVRSF